MEETFISEERGIEYKVPWCCGSKMLPQYTHRGVGGDLYRKFICCDCGNTESIRVDEETEENKPKSSDPVG